MRLILTALLSLVLIYPRPVSSTVSRLAECVDLDGKGLRIAVPPDLLHKNYLDDYFLRFGCYSNMTFVTLSDSDIASNMETYIASASLDLVFVESTGLLASLLVLFPHLELIATAIQNYSTGMIEDVSGILFRRFDEHTDVSSWEELVNSSTTSVLSLCAVQNNSQAFTGFQVQAGEFLSMSNRRLEESFKMRWKQTQQQVLSDVEQRLCDFGAVDAAMPINPSTLALIGATSTSGFPFSHSTELYPKGAFVRLPHLAMRLGELFRMGLIAMEERDGAYPGDYAGFTFPRDYTQSIALAYDLDFSGNGRCRPGYFRLLTEGKRCAACPTGKFSPNGVGECQLCVPRFYNNETGATACGRCTAGLTTYAKGSSICVPDMGVRFDPVAACSQNRNRPLVIAVLQDGDKAVARARWSWTFDALLNAYLNQFTCSIHMEIMPRTELLATVANASIDFVFVDPGFYVVLEHKHSLVALAKVVQNYAGLITGAHGGVVFRHKSRNLDLYILTHVSEANRNLTLCAVNVDSFFGWTVQCYEFFKQRLDVRQVFAQVVFAGSHEEVVKRVSLGDCDVGMAESTAVNPNEYTLLNEIVSNASIHASTPLYNTWPIAALPHVPGQIRQLVMDPLYATSYDSEHAINSNFAGFFRVEKFEAEANVMFDLDLVDPSIGLCRPGSSRNWTSPLKPCQKCAKGRFKEDGWDPDRFGAELCHACPPGSYSDEIGLAHCKECPEGKITYEYGQTQCQDSTANSVYHPIEGCAVLPNRTLIVGVLKDISVERTMSEWRPTFQDLLNQNFNRYRCYFEMKALDWQEMTQAVERGAIDLVFSDPGLFVLYELHHGLSAVASVLRLKGGRANPFRAGVIIRSAALNKDLTTLQDVASAGASRSLSACPVNEDSFEGWQAQWFEFFKAGLDVKKIFKSVNFTGSHTVTAALVATGACDVGFMGSDTLSLLAEADVWEIETFAIINKRSHENVGFIAKASTDLYPDWVLSSSPRVGEEILKLLEAPLLSLQLPHPAAIAGSYAGFTLPLDYRGVAQVRYELDLMDPVLGLCPPGSSRNWSSPLKPCQKCAKGRSKEDGWDADRFGAELCHACAPGSYSDEIGLAHCKRCPEGKITYEYGQIECVKSGDVFLFAKIEACAAFLNNTLTVGVLSDINKSETTMQWKPTFEDLLNHFLNRYHCFFKMVVMDWREMTQAVKTQEVDLVFADPGLVVAYERKYNTKAVATVLRVFDGFIYPSTAGVIFRSSSRNEDLVTLQDVANAARSRTLTACPVHEDSFEGWQAQWYEFFKAGLDIDQVLLVKTFTDSHEESARLVATGACDVGFASSNTLEKLAAEDVFEIETFFIINRRKHSGFISASSTDLYPQWTLAVLPHVSQAIVGVVDVPLRSLEESDEASIIGQLAGFTAPKDYSSVAQVRFQLGVEPLNSCGPGAYRNVAANLNPCVPCPAGWVSKDGVGSCTACPIGYVAPLNGSSTCEQCDFGFLTEEAGSTTCVPYEAEIIMNHMAQISVCVLVAIVFWFCVTMLFLVVAYRNTKLMKASSSIFNVVIVTGAILVSASTLLFTVMPANDWICSLRWWMPCIFSSMVFGTLFSKTYRLFKIFQIYERKQKIPQAIKFKDIKVAALVGCFVGTTALVLMIFFLADPPFFKKAYVQVDSQPYWTYVKACHVSVVFTPLIFTLYTLLLITQSVLAFRVRNLPTIFNESRLIAWLLYNTVFIGLVAIMVDFQLPVTQPVARMAVRSLALLIGAATPVVVLYVPKVVSIWKDQQNDSKFSTNHSNTNTNINNQELISQAKSQQVYTDSKVTMTSPAIEDRNLVVEKSHRSALSNISGLSDNEIEEAMENMQLEIFPSEQLSGDEGYFYCAPADFRLANVVIPRTSASRTSASPSSTSRRCKVTSARAANAPVSGTPSTSRQRLQVNVSAEMTTLSTPPSASRRTPKATPPHTTPPSATGALQSVAELVPQLAQADATELSELPMDRLVVRSATAPSELSRLDEAAKQSTHDPAASDTSIPGLDHDPSPDPSPNPSLSPKFANATVSLRTGRNASRENNVEEIKGGSPQLAEVAYPTFSSRSASPRVQPRRSMDHPRNDSGSGTLQMASPRETGPAFMRSVPGGGSPSVASLPMASDPLRRSNSADLRAKVRYQGGRTPSSATSKLQHRMNLITLALGTGAEDNLDDNDDEPNLVA